MQPTRIYSRAIAVISFPEYWAGRLGPDVGLEEVGLAGLSGKPYLGLSASLVSKSLDGLAQLVEAGRWLGDGVEQDTDSESAMPSPWMSLTRK